MSLVVSLLVHPQSQESAQVKSGRMVKSGQSCLWAKSPTVGRVSSEKRIDTPGGIDEPVTMSCKWRRCGIAVLQYPTKIVICKPRVS